MLQSVTGYSVTLQVNAGLYLVENPSMQVQQTANGNVAIEFDWRSWLRYIAIAAISYWFGGGQIPFPFPTPIPQPPAPYVPPPPPLPPPPPPVPPPVPPQPAPPAPKADPIGAIVRVSHGNSGCTGIHLGDLLKSGHSYWLTAAHCTGSFGSTITITMQNNNRVQAVVVKRDTNADISIARSPAAVGYPFALLAKELPQPGTEVWHRGYGIDRPGNFEHGSVVGVMHVAQQLHFRLSVSSGDSGSAICRKDTGEIVGVVCCTSGAAMYGGHCVRVRQMLTELGEITENPLTCLPDEIVTFSPLRQTG